MEEIKTTDKRDIEPIYDGDLSYKSIKNNPVLRPISVMNNSYENFELIIRNALFDFEKDKKNIDEIIESNPTYSQTILVSKLNDILRTIKTLVHSLDCQKENMKESLKEMIEIVEEEYAPLKEESIINYPQVEKEQKINEKQEERTEEIENKKSSEITIESYGKNSTEEIEEPISTNQQTEQEQKINEDEKEETFHSNLIDKEITKPKRQKFIPIGQTQR